MAVNRITKRWLINNFGIIILVLIIIEIFLSLGVKNSYYESVSKSMKSQGKTMLNLMNKDYSDSTTNHEPEVRYIVQNFTERNKMELTAIDGEGNIVITSSGFDIVNKPEMPDYKLIASGDEKVISQGYVEKVYDLNGENVMAITYILPSRAQSISYIRLATSLTDIDRQIILIIAITGLIGVAIIVFVAISSSYFIKSIVIPIEDIGITARKIAQGDFEMRLKNKNDDEIGDLCEVINYMASELATSEKMKNEFISSISHELRTPLTAIRGWAETVNTSGTKDQEILQKGMGVIISETERLSDMVEELLDFSRMENGSMKLIISKIDIVAELEDVMIMFEQRAKKENISILSKVPDECIPVMGDKNRLRQVFVNILDNALKYSGAGRKVVISVSSWNDFAIIKIIDNGCGISAKDLPKIKKKFYKANYSKRGSGIGLAVADEIVRLHNGSLDVYSVEGQGTTIIVQIPIAKK